MRQPLATASVNENGQPGRRLSVFVSARLFFSGMLLLWLAAQSASQAQAIDASSLNDLAQLARAGAPQLALRRMDVEQPDAGKDPVGWMAWEQERLQILANQAMYAVLIARVDALPDSVDARFRLFAASLKADAQLQTGEADAARATLRDLLWSSAEGQSREMLSQWRQLVIRSYVIQDRNEDARLALLRYRQDFGNEDPHWRWLNAQVMLRTGQQEAAIRLLEKDRSEQGLFLRYSAELRITPQKAAAILQAAVKQAQKSASPALQGVFWALAAEAAAKAGERRAVIDYLEKALSLPLDRQLVHGIMAVDADNLWDAYLDEGKRIGNAEKKLLGSDEDWYFPATEAIESDPLRARILFSVLGEYGTDPQRRSLAHEYLVGLLGDLPNGQSLINRLYLHSNRYADVDSLPPVIRYRLIDEALAAGELDTTSRLMAGLTAPPGGSDRFDWDLRRARVAIFTGDTKAGVMLLQQLLDGEQQDWSQQRVDRFLQVVFDLQTVKLHEQALVLFAGLLDKPLDANQRRELIFWMADSAQGLERYDEAAYLYIKSATLNDPTAMDPWAQTARYRAAKALAEAGLLDDARSIYASLLRATKDASRKAVLQNELQRLHLVSGDKSAVK